MKKTILTSSIGGALLALTLSACGGGSDDTASDKPFGDCEVTENPTVHELDTMTEGVLTVAATLPYPAGYRGNTLESVDGGYMYCLDAEIANRAGLDEIKLVNTPFEALVTAQSSNFDFAVWDIYDTPERRKAVDFAAPYNTYETGVLVKKDSDLTPESITTAQLGVLSGSVQLAYVEENMPDAQVKVFANNDDLFNSLLAGQIDAALNDTATVMPRAKESNDQLEVIGRYPAGGDVAPLVPKGSANLEPLTQIIEDMRADGTLDAIMTKWLNPILGGDPQELPDWSA